MADVIGRDHPSAALSRVLIACANKPALKALFGQLLATVSVLLERGLGAQARGAVTASPGCRFTMAWKDKDDADLQGPALDRLLLSHVCAGRALLQGEEIVGLATDKGNIKSLNLQVSAVATPGNHTIFCCPQVPTCAN